jgi:hypothetical protein
LASRSCAFAAWPSVRRGNRYFEPSGGNRSSQAVELADAGRRIVRPESDAPSLPRRRLDGRREDLAAAALAFAPGGVDAVLAFVGGKPLTRLLDGVRHGGRVAFPNGRAG